MTPKPYPTDPLEIMRDALAAAYDDHHDWSTRPCGNCAQASRLLGRAVGCVLHRQRQIELQARRR